VLYEFLYRACPAWLVGERQADAWERRRALGDVEASFRNVGDYTGRVSAIREVGKGETLRHMSDRECRVVELDLDAEALESVRCRETKVVGGRLVPATFDDRWGAVADMLRVSFADAEQREVSEPLEIEAAQQRQMEALGQYEAAWIQYWADVRAEYERQTGYDADDRDWKDVLARVFPGLDLEAPDFPIQRPEPPVLEPIPESVFANEAVRLRRGLPKTEAHTGTGLYAAKETPTYLERVQDGAPVGQVIKLTVGGLGTSDAYKGGYAKTGSMSGTDEQPTATGSPTGGHSWDASSQYSGGTVPWYGADDTNSTYWRAALDVTTGWWRWIPPAGVCIGRISLTSWGSNAPKNFTIEGWDTDHWDVLETITNETGWGGPETRYFLVSNSFEYTQYRINVTANNGGNALQIYEAEWFEFSEEIRAIVSHIDDEVTLEGDLTNWIGGSDVGVYDAWSAVQLTLDQLTLDQGSTGFAAIQYIRIFAGTYDENVIPNANLNPNESTGHTLVIEGDPADDRDNIIIQPTGGARCIYINLDHIVIRHLKCDATAGASNEAIRNYYQGSTGIEVRDCTVMGNGADHAIEATEAVVSDCEVTSAGFRGVNIQYGRVERCTVKNTGAKGTTIGILISYVASVVDCTVRGFNSGFQLSGAGGHPWTEIVNCTIYDCDYGITVWRQLSQFEIVNTTSAMTRSPTKVSVT
jgi:hypothetical protein